MPAVILHRIDRARNMHRYYRLDVQPDLFGEWGVVREWGRIGQAGRYRIDPYPTAAQAEERMQFQQAAKQGRGYVIPNFSAISCRAASGFDVTTKNDVTPLSP